MTAVNWELLPGETVEAFVAAYPDVASQHTGESDEFAFMFVAPLTIGYDGQTISFDARVITHTPSARVAELVGVEGVNVGDIVRLVPGKTSQITRRIARFAEQDPEVPGVDQ